MLNTPHFCTMRVSVANLFFQSLWYFHAVILSVENQTPKVCTFFNFLTLKTNISIHRHT